jgi:hypothetical protein
MASQTEALRTGEFLISEANGHRSREQIVVKTASGVVGAGTVMSLGNDGKYVPYESGSSDGHDTAAGVLYAAVDATSSDQPAVLIARDAEVAQSMLVGVDSDDSAIADLAALGVFAR